MTTEMSVPKKSDRKKEPVRLGIPPDVRSATEKKLTGSSKEAVRLGIPPDVRLVSPQKLRSEDRKKAGAGRMRQLVRRSRKKSASEKGSK